MSPKLVLNTNNYNRNNEQQFDKYAMLKGCNFGCHPHWIMHVLTKHYSIFKL